MTSSWYVVYQLIEAERRNSSVSGSDICLPRVLCQAITWTNADLLLIGTLETNFNEFQSKYKTEFQTSVCEIVVIWSRPLCVRWILFDVSIVDYHQNPILGKIAYARTDLLHKHRVYPIKHSQGAPFTNMV